MEILQTENYYIINKNEESLWFNRKTGAFECKTCWDMATANNPVCLGLIYGIIGKIQILPEFSPKLILITGVKDVGSETEKKTIDNIYCITNIFILPITSPPDSEFNFLHCHKHHTQYSNSISQDCKNILKFGDFQQKVGLSKTLGSIKNVTSSIKSATANVAANATGQIKTKKDTKDKERFERRIFDEIYKMFDETDSFYFSNGLDITNSLQKQHDPSYDHSKPLWQRADERFFWNKHMLLDLINKDGIPDTWLIPVIQGFIQIETIPLDIKMASFLKSSGANEESVPNSLCTLTIVSRRSRCRAGTRYKRRGVDEDGNVANYVETEQIVTFLHHKMSFVQVRGSVPVFWSQPGFKYRPPPRLDKGFEETSLAFRKHFEKELELYERVFCVSLVEQGGNEKVIADSYLNNILYLDSPSLTYISFDFHEYCRGLRYENVMVLIEGIHDIINSVSFCWVDSEGVICHQNGVFRVNCVDCLDRTNVVQIAFAKAVLENEFAKLGIIPPDHSLPDKCRSILQQMWANNGDTISKQYAGTSALKGDFTRTGERRFAGLMKDGMNSANRYYLNRFKDAYRQAAIDSILGKVITEDIMSFNPEAGEVEDASIAQHVKHVIDDCKKLLVPDAETILGAWGLIDADPVTGDLDQMDMDIILVLTRDSYYVAQYDEETDKILHFERVSLIDLDQIQLGPYTYQGVFKQSRTFFCIRLVYQLGGQAGFYHTFRSMNIRFFNNMAITIKTEEEFVESLKSIGDTFEVAVQMIGCEVELYSGKLEKMKSKKSSPLVNPLQLFSPLSNLTKTSPDSLKTVGNRAFSNMTSGLAKLNPLSNLRFKQGNEQQETTAVDSQLINSKPSLELLNCETMRDDLHIDSCGIISSFGDADTDKVAATSLLKTTSASNLTQLDSTRALTPEILVSDEGVFPKSRCKDGPLILSHSFDDICPKDTGDTKGYIQKASSATGLDIAQNDEKIGSNFVPKSSSLFSPLSPLANLNKEAVLAPFSVFAKGVQSLAPGAGKLAKGVQNIGANLDPRKLRAQRKQQLEADLELNKKILVCQSSIIRF